MNDVASVCSVEPGPLIVFLAGLFTREKNKRPLVGPKLSNGDRALIRRFARPEPTKMKVVQCLVMAQAGGDDFEDDRFRHWCALMQAMAMIAGTNVEAEPHNPASKFGMIMAEVLASPQSKDFAIRDLRFLNLMEAEGEVFDQLLTRMIRRLAAADVKNLDFVDLWELLQSAPGDRTRLAIARQFYGATAASSAPAQP